MTPADQRREYGTGSVYQRHSDWRWIGTLEAGWNADGSRRRVTVSGKGCEGGCKSRCPHRAAIKRKLEAKKTALRAGESGSGHVTVKQWADTYLQMRVAELRPKAYNAAANPIRRWVIPTIGHKRLDLLTPGDVRAVHTACRKAGRQAADVHRALHTMLNAAVAEGHTVAPRVLMVKAPTPPRSDRQSMTVEEGLACVRVAADHPRGARWLFALIYGQRMGECLGITRDAVDLDAGAFGEVVIEWQLQTLPYNTPRDRSSGFRVPDGHEARHLVDAYHLVRPKSGAGYRVAPLLAPVRDAMRHALEVAPANPWGLVWPEPNGRPMNDKHDRAEWYALQAAAGVAHPSGRPYHVHECRNFAATMLLEAGVDEHVITSLLGHSSIVTSRRYMTVRREPLLEGLARAAERLQLG